MGRIRVSVIGAGSWTVTSHLPSLMQHDDVELVGVCRKGPELLERIKDDWGFKFASENYEDILNEQADVVVVASPSAMHATHASAALRTGAHVMCEKPFTVDPQEAWNLDLLTQQVGRELVIAFGWNYRPMVQKARGLMDEFGVGDLEHLSVVMATVTRDLLSNRGAYPKASAESVPEQATWTDARISGGGYGQAQLSHALGMALWLTGARAASGFAMNSAPLDAPVELHNAITFTYDGGAIGVVSGASTHTGVWNDMNALEIRGIGSEGQFLIDLGREAFWLNSQGDDHNLSLSPGDGSYDCVGPIDAILAAARGRGFNNQSPPELGARTVEALDIAYRSAASGKVELRN